MVHLVGGRRGIVAAQYLWNAAQGPEGCLQYLPQGQEGLTGGDLSVASSPIAQHAFEQRVAMGPQCRSRRWRFMGARQSAAQWRNHVQLSSGRTTSQTRRNAGNLVNICVLRAINWIAYHDINGRANLSQVKIMHHPDLQPLTAAQRAALPPLEELPTISTPNCGPPPPEQFELLVESIRQDPDQVALTLCEGMLLDGQERRKACLVTGADPMFEEYVGSDPAGYLLRTNVFRRQLTQSQITMAVVELRQSAPPGRPRNAEQRAGFSDDVHQFTSNELAIESGSSDRYVRKAKRVAREGLSHRVHSGELSINAAN